MDFLKSIISESTRHIHSIDQYKNINQLKFTKELVKIIKSLIKLIILSPNKAEIITRNKDIVYFEFLITLINSISIMPLIIKILKITIKENLKEINDTRSKFSHKN